MRKNKITWLTMWGKKYDYTLCCHWHRLAGHIILSKFYKTSSICYRDMLIIFPSVLYFNHIQKTIISSTKCIGANFKLEWFLSFWHVRMESDRACNNPGCVFVFQSYRLFSMKQLWCQGLFRPLLCGGFFAWFRNSYEGILNSNWYIGNYISILQFRICIELRKKTTNYKLRLWALSINASTKRKVFALSHLPLCVQTRHEAVS